jgi:hypothetical protein
MKGGTNMTINKYAAVPIVALTLIGGALLATNPASAEETVGFGWRHFGDDSIVQRIAQRFSLNEGDVEAVFNEQRIEMGTQMQARLEDELNDAVKAGKLTEVQKQKILAKRTELRNEHQDQLLEFKAGENPTQEEFEAIRASHQQDLDELKQWAEDNDVPYEYLMPQMGIRHGMRGSGAGTGVGGNMKFRTGFGPGFQADAE